MRAAVYYGPGQIRVEQVPAPPREPRGALIRVDVALVCATDVKTWRSGHPLITPPVILGHEFVGTVVEVRGVSGLAAGDRVTAAPYVECTRCSSCRHGLPELCESRQYPSNGAFAEFVAVSSRFARRGVVRLPADRPAEAGAFIEPLACVLNGLEQVRWRPGEFAVIAGAGPMGLLHLLVMRDRAGGIVVSEPEPARRAAAAALGAETCEPAEVLDAVRRRTEGRGADVVIVAVGAPAAAVEGLPLARRGGRVLWFGGFPPNSSVAFDPNIVHYRQVAVHGSSGFASRHFRRAAALVAAGLDPAPLITHRLPLPAVADALELAGGRTGLKVALDITESDA